LGILDNVLGDQVESEEDILATVMTDATPSRLYRYRPITDQTIDREVATIRDNLVYCPHFDQMNDPMEGTHTESALLRETKNYRALLSKISAAKARLGIASFSEVYDHEPMWAHYAGNFSGICIAYNFRFLLRGLPDDTEFVRMSYNERPPIFLKDKRTVLELAKLALSTKAVRWMSEREWRLIRPHRGSAVYDNNKCVTRIYVGSRIEKSHRDTIRTAAKALKIPLFEMQIDKYEMTFKRHLFRPGKSK
jgi:hypothetical protein